MVPYVVSVVPFLCVLCAPLNEYQEEHEGHKGKAHNEYEVSWNSEFTTQTSSPSRNRS